MSGRHIGYIDDVPMMVSRRFRPKEYADEVNEPLPRLPDVNKHLDELHYDFRDESETIRVAELYENHRLKQEKDEDEKNKVKHEQMTLRNIKIAEDTLKQMRVSAVGLNEPVVSASTAVNSSKGRENGYMISGSLSCSNISDQVPSSKSVPVPSILTPVTSVNVHDQNGRIMNSSQTNSIKTVINPSDFESELFASSPFDDAMLKAIDDRSELNSIFQNAYSSQSASYNPVNNVQNNNTTTNSSLNGFSSHLN
ncbi:hypothetical protein HDE_12705 [Halotydeus destructor]|nr:hypothetical protein HDE_12705 [Halotydeus destructor]